MRLHRDARMVRTSSSLKSLSLLVFFLKYGRNDNQFKAWQTDPHPPPTGVLPIIEAYGVHQKLNSIFLPELLPVVFDDSGHVLDMTCITNKGHKICLIKEHKL